MAKKYSSGGKKIKDVDDDEGMESEEETEESEVEEEGESEKEESDKDESDKEESEKEESEKEESEKEVTDIEEDPEEESGEENVLKSTDKYNETCFYKIKRKKQAKILDSDVVDQDFFDDQPEILTGRIVKPEERITKNILTKYERVRLLATRRKQLILGAKPMVKLPKKIAEKDIANIELKAKVIPIIIVRTLPNGDIEHWKLNELEIVN